MEKNKIIFLQIFILIIAIFANSYIISESFLTKEKNNESILDKLSNLIFDFFSIKQIGIVSATSTNPSCCKITISGEKCQNVFSANECAEGFIRDIACSETEDCQIGCCIYNDGEMCTPQSSKFFCKKEEGVFGIGDGNCEINNLCLGGCCNLGDSYAFVTGKICEIRSMEKGIVPNIDYSKNEGMCIFGQMSDENLAEYTGNMGACVVKDEYEGNSCSITTKEDCNDNFYLGYLCTNPILETECTKTENTICFEEGNRRGKIYYVDSCNNIANIYDSNKYNDNSYWNEIIPENDDELCDVNSRGFEKCGNCDINAGSICGLAKEAGVTPVYGDYACRKMDCDNAPTAISATGRILSKTNKKNGETWCLYDSAIGIKKSIFENNISADAPGSEHWIASCINGKVSAELAGEQRDSICVETKIHDPNTNTDFSRAVRFPKQSTICAGYNQADENGNINETKMIEDCNANSLCQIMDISVDANFRFKLCVAKNPPGLKLRDLTEEDKFRRDSTCQIANVTCTAIHVDEGVLGDEYWINYNCLTPVFQKEMNDFCISLGDCGSYINYAGYGTNNIQLEYYPNLVKWENYKQFKNVIAGDVMTSSVLDAVMQEIVEDARINFINEQGIDRGESGTGTTTPSRDFFKNGWKGFGIGMDFMWDTVRLLFIQSWDIHNFTENLRGMANSFLNVFGFGGSTSVYSVKFTCKPWQAPVGGENCDICNHDPLGRKCTEYKCQSLGQACYLLNKDTDNPTCQKAKDDEIAPLIRKGDISEGFEFGANAEIGFAGVSIISKTSDERGKKCLGKYELMNFTLNTNEYAQCKYSFTDPLLDGINNYEDMDGLYPDENNEFLLVHNFTINSAELNLINDNIDSEHNSDLRRDYYDMRMYLKCIDFFNHPTQTYHIDFCVSANDEDPVDYERIIFTPAKNSYLKFNATHQVMTMNLPEPAQCKYSTNSETRYEDMENIMTCSLPLTNPEENTNSLSLTRQCYTNLTNLIEGENKIYFRCNDSVGNINQDSFEYKVFVSEYELKIDSININVNFKNNVYSPNAQGLLTLGGTPQLSGVDVKLIVKTSGGLNNGDSNCKFSENSGSYINFYEKESSTKTQILPSKLNGEYNINVICEDSVGNSATKKIYFKLETDNIPPKILRFYQEGVNLKMITDEKATCFLSLDEEKECMFDIKNATSMTTGLSLTHSAILSQDKKHYIKCLDKWDNSIPGCSLIIKTSNTQQV